MKKMKIDKKRLGAIVHYIIVVCEYTVVIFLAIWLNIVLKFPSLSSFLFKAFGSTLAAFGLFLTVWSCWLQFKIGQGTTGFSEPTKKLVTYRLYGIVRNPMMLSQFLFLAGLGFLLDLVAMFLILPILILFMHLFIIFIEEPNLKSRFGKDWENYVRKYLGGSLDLVGLRAIKIQSIHSFLVRQDSPNMGYVAHYVCSNPEFIRNSYTNSVI